MKEQFEEDSKGGIPQLYFLNFSFLTPSSSPWRLTTKLDNYYTRLQEVDKD
jgi:hypothetical protein